jgi:hypothetical protein
VAEPAIAHQTQSLDGGLSWRHVCGRQGQRFLAVDDFRHMPVVHDHPRYPRGLTKYESHVSDLPGIDRNQTVKDRVDRSTHPVMPVRVTGIHGLPC